MATYTTQKSQTYGTVVGQGMARAVMVDMVSVAMTTAMLDNANDEVELLWVPAGAVIVGVELRATDMDSGGSPALKFDVGDDSDEDRLIAATTTGQAAGSTMTLETTGFGYKYATATKLKAYINTAAATAAAGTLYFRVSYFVDPNFSLTNAVVS